MAIELPTFFVKETKRVDRQNYPIVETCYLNMYLSGSYELNLQRQGYNDNVQLLESKISDVYLLNSSPVITASTKDIQVFCRGDIAHITISSSDPLPAGISGYSWTGHYNTRGISNIPL